jgi:hypothetical protein
MLQYIVSDSLCSEWLSLYSCRPISRPMSTYKFWSHLIVEFLLHFRSLIFSVASNLSPSSKLLQQNVLFGLVVVLSECGFGRCHWIVTVGDGGAEGIYLTKNDAIFRTINHKSIALNCANTVHVAVAFT